MSTAAEMVRELVRELPEPFTSRQVAERLPEFHHTHVCNIMRDLEHDSEIEGRPIARGRQRGLRYWRTRHFRGAPVNPATQFEGSLFLQQISLTWGFWCAERAARLQSIHAAD